MTKKTVTSDTLKLLKTEYKNAKVLLEKFNKNTLKYNNRIKEISNSIVNFKHSLIKTPI
jgi:hypothetical protein